MIVGEWLKTTGIQIYDFLSESTDVLFEFRIAAKGIQRRPSACPDLCKHGIVLVRQFVPK